MSDEIAMMSLGGARVNSRGTIASLQDDQNWIVSGSWRLLVESSEGNKTDPTISFRSTFAMVMPDGNAKHKHTISNFELTDWHMDDSTATINGTATINLRDGPMNDVPVSKKIMNRNGIAILVDTDVVDHFGDTPIYGVVTRMRAL